MISLNDYDLVFGAKWLKRTGPIWWDFSNLILNFKIQGIKVRLNGIETNCTTLISWQERKKAFKEKQPMAVL